MLAVAPGWARVHPGEVLRVGLVAHGGADGGVDGEGDALLGPKAVCDAADGLAVGRLGAVGVEGADHVLGAGALGGGDVAEGLGAAVVQEEVRALEDG